MNPPNALFCGDCGYPLSLSPGRWARVLSLKQRLLDHPHRNSVFACAAAGAVALPLGVTVASNPTGWTQIFALPWDWQFAAWVFVMPPSIATYVLYVIYPRKWRILAFFLGVFFELVGILLWTAIAVKVGDVIPRH
jgi:hypothetical protein